MASPTELIADARITPFNIGRRIELRDFTAEEAAPLAAGLGPHGPALLARILHWTHGHPFLTQKLCAALQETSGEETEKSGKHPAGATEAGTTASKPTATVPPLTPHSSPLTPRSVDRLCQALFLNVRAREGDDNLRFVADRLLRGTDEPAAVLALYAKVRRGEAVTEDPTDPVEETLRLSGIVRGERGRLAVRNRIYAQVFDAKWIAAQTEPAEARRQREAERRGRNRVLALAGTVLAVMAALTGWALQSEGKARQQTDAAQRASYIATLNLIQREWEADPPRVGRVLELLEETRHNPHRGFEWGYWNHLCHLDLLALKGHTDDVRAVAFAPDGQRVLTGSDDGTAKLWDAATGQEVLTLKGHTGPVRAVAFAPDGEQVLTGSADGTAKLWDAATGRELLTLKEGTSGVQAVAFAPDGQRVLTGSWNGTAKVWGAATGREVLTLKGHSGIVQAVAFAPDGRRVLTGSDDGTANLWFSDPEAGAAPGARAAQRSGAAGGFGRREHVRAEAQRAVRGRARSPGTVRCACVDAGSFFAPVGATTTGACWGGAGAAAGRFPVTLSVARGDSSVSGSGGRRFGASPLPACRAATENAATIRGPRCHGGGEPLPNQPVPS